MLHEESDSAPLLDLFRPDVEGDAVEDAGTAGFRTLELEFVSLLAAPLELLVASFRLVTLIVSVLDPIAESLRITASPVFGRSDAIVFVASATSSALLDGLRTVASPVLDPAIESLRFPLVLDSGEREEEANVVLGLVDSLGLGLGVRTPQ
jgi:hypothetical protein